ncbi:MAG: hypothetical protein NC116_10065 [Clostridium sp.]|nr:hypothetical protein [Clostridium sp.]
MLIIVFLPVSGKKNIREPALYVEKSRKTVEKCMFYVEKPIENMLKNIRVIHRGKIIKMTGTVNVDNGKTFPPDFHILSTVMKSVEQV